jgi:hypothetical protein
MLACLRKEKFFISFTSYESFFITFNIRSTLNIIPIFQEVKGFFFTSIILMISIGYIQDVSSYLLNFNFYIEFTPIERAGL